MNCCVMTIEDHWRKSCELVTTKIFLFDNSKLVHKKQIFTLDNSGYLICNKFILVALVWRTPLCFGCIRVENDFVIFY